jgi:ring-1,2-phenylacetyl-CoA epoxidase subunit PaaA
VSDVIERTYSVKSISYDDFHGMSEEYRKYVIRILSMQAYAEKMGAEEMGYQLRLAPNAISRRALAGIVCDEANHALLLYRILDKLGISEEESLSIAEGKAPGSKATQSMEGAVAVGDEENSWIDLVLNNMLMDRAGSFIVSNFMESSFEPWAVACEKIYKDEQWHKRFGEEQLLKYSTMNDMSNLQERFTTWYARALNFFGPKSIKTQAKLEKYGVKRRSNDTLREDFVSEVKAFLVDNDLEHLLMPGVKGPYPYKFNKND